MVGLIAVGLIAVGIIVRGRGYVAATPPVNRQSQIPPPTKPSGRPQLTTLIFQLR